MYIAITLLYRCCIYVCTCAIWPSLFPCYLYVHTATTFTARSTMPDGIIYPYLILTTSAIWKTNYDTIRSIYCLFAYQISRIITGEPWRDHFRPNPLLSRQSYRTSSLCVATASEKIRRPRINQRDSVWKRPVHNSAIPYGQFLWLLVFVVYGTVDGKEPVRHVQLRLSGIELSGWIFRRWKLLVEEIVMEVRVGIICIPR
jgi:hypothetical protein